MWYSDKIEYNFVFTKRIQNWVAEIRMDLSLKVPENNPDLTLSFWWVFFYFFGQEKSRKMARKCLWVWASSHTLKQKCVEMKWNAISVVVVHTGTIDWNQSTQKSFSLFQGPYKKKYRLMVIHILVSWEQINHFGSDCIRNLWHCKGGEVQWEVPGHHSEGQW